MGRVKGRTARAEHVERRPSEHRCAGRRRAADKR